MNKNFFFEDITILMGSNSGIIKDSLLILDGKIKAFGQKAIEEALKNNITVSKSGNKVIAPMLVDIHSILEDPLTGFADNLKNVRSRAKKSGFGTIAFLPNSRNWRDKPEAIPFQINNESDINILFWGSFTLGDEGLKLSPHYELLESGAIGLASSTFNNSSIIFKGLTLDAVNSAPILFSTTRKNSTQKGIVNSCLLYTSPSPRDS